MSDMSGAATSSTFTAPARHLTLDDLIVTWARRDSEYARRARTMQPEEIETIKLCRLREAHMLPDPKERRNAFTRAKTWYPPQHGQS